MIRFCAYSEEKGRRGKWMEPYQMPQMEEEIKRLREVSNANQKKVNSGVFAAGKMEKLQRMGQTQEQLQEREEGKKYGIFQGILFLVMAAMLLGGTKGNETVTQVVSQIGKTIQQIGQKVEEQKWFSFEDKTEEKDTQKE